MLLGTYVTSHTPLSGLLGHATSKNQQKPAEILVVEKTYFIPHQ